MSKVNRRHFLKTTALTASAFLSLPLAGCKKAGKSQQSKWPGFKYAMCNESMKELSWADQCKIVANAGYKGIEVAAFTLVEQTVGEISPARRKDMVKTTKDYGIEYAGLHWLLAPPPPGLHITTPEETTRNKTIAYLDQLIDFCGDLGGPYMIFGSPKQRNATGISVEDAKKYFAEGLSQLASHAQQRNIKILVEHLDHTQTNVVNTLAEALEIVKTVNHPAIGMMFDFHNTADETEPLDILMRKFYKHIYHIHVMEMDGKYLGTGNAVNDYVKAFQILKDLGYDKWVSLEVFDFTPGGKTIATESMKVLKEIEAKLG